MARSFCNDLLVELHVPDFQQAYDFYRLLGFELSWMEPNYMVMRRERAVIAFYGGSPSVSQHSYFGRFPEGSKRGYGVEVVIFVDNVEDLHNRVAEKMSVVAPLQLRPWGRWDFRVEDPFGFYVRITERYNPGQQPKKERETPEVAAKLGLRL